MNFTRMIVDGIGWGLVAFVVLPLWLYYAAKFLTVGYRLGQYRADKLIERFKHDEQ